MKILRISGSLRKGSSNMTALDAMAKIATKNVDFTITTYTQGRMVFELN